MPLISDELLQQLVDASYRLAVTVHYEDVPPMGAEIPVVNALRRAKRKFGIQPTDYVTFGDLHAFIGEPPSQSEPSSKYTPHQYVYYVLTRNEVDNLIDKHLGVSGYAWAETWDSDDYTGFFTVDLKSYLETDRQMLNQFLADPSYTTLPLSLVLCELAERKVLPEGEYMVWVA